MRSLLVLLLLAMPAGCAHRAQNLAARKERPPPRGDFQQSAARDRAAPAARAGTRVALPAP